MTPPKVFLGIPIYGGTPWGFTESFTKLCVAPPVSIEAVPLVGDSLVSRARNTLTARFLASDSTHLLFIDSDLVFSGEQIKRMVEHDVDLVAGFYPKKKDGDLEWVCNAAPDQEETDERGLVSVKYMGTGFMLIKRRVFDQMIGRYGREISYTADGTGLAEHDFWSVGVHAGRYLSEDWFFCQRWLDMGGKVYGDTKVILKHIGSATYPLQHQEAAIIARSQPVKPALKRTKRRVLKAA